MTKSFDTLDIYLSAFLSLHNVEPALETKNGKVVFCFAATDETYKLMGLFNSNTKIPCLDLVTAIKTLRGKMLTAKESIHGNGYERNFNR